MSEWNDTTTSKLIENGVLKIGDGYRARNSELASEGIPFARAGNINGGFQFEGADCLPENYVDIVGDKASIPGDTVFTSKGTVGRFAFVTDKVSQFVYSPQLCFWRSMKHDVVLPKFIYYWMHGRQFLGQVDSVKGQTDMADYVNLADQRKMTITLPSQTEQQAIASVLSNLDDKIDLLHRQNKTLEAMAETLFRQWFVEEAQEDLEEGALGDFAINPKIGVRPRDIDPAMKYIGLEHIDRRSIALIKSGHADDVTSNKFRFSEGDILFGKLRPYFHKVCFAPFEGVCSTDILVIRPKKPHYFAYCLFAFYQNDVVEYANLGSGGTRMPRTNWETLSQYPVAMPTEAKLLDFNNLLEPMISKIKENIVQIHTLEKLRNTLLPKLMSGEIIITAA